MRAIRKRFLLALLPLLILLAICSCNTRHGVADNLLARIDSLADVNPDSADILLKHTPVPSLKERENEEVCKLLRIKIDDKLYRPVTHYRDTILQLIDVFEHHRRVLPNLLGSTGPALPYLYAGRVFADLGDAPQALDYYQKALDAIPKGEMEKGEWKKDNKDDRRLAKQRGLLYSFIGTILAYQKIDDESLHSFMQANQYAEFAKDTVDIIFNYRDIAGQYKALGKNDSSLLYYQKALTIAEKNHNANMQNDVKSQMASLYVTIGDFQKARKSLEPALQHIDTPSITSLYNIASKIYRHEGKIDSALVCYRNLLQYGNVYGKRNAHRELSELAMQRGHLYEASEHFSLYKELVDSIQKRDNAEAVARMHAAYNYQKHANEAQRLKEANDRMRLWLLLLALTLVSILATLLIVFISRRYKNQLRKSNLSKLELLRLSHEQFSAERELQAQSEIRNSAIYETIQRCIREGNDQTLTDEEWDLLSQTVNKAYKNFEDKLLGLVALNEQDYRICLLIKMNVKPIHIAQLTARSPEAISSSRRRLYERVTNTKGKPQDWDAIVHLL